EFTTNVGGKIVFTLDQNNIPIRYHWVDSPGGFRKLNPQENYGEIDSLLLGKYYSEELDLKVKVKLTVEESELKIKFGLFSGKKVIRLDRNYFWIPKENMVFEFTEDNLFIHADRASNIRFKRLKCRISTGSM
ncbi:MAG: hypothetical protein JKY54_00775, partial [Flavobacteriales bacterium]|nr:hypothetical protein [Flavobacteriales bacterium]